jgi:signal transduction histidine kinase
MRISGEGKAMRALPVHLLSIAVFIAVVGFVWWKVGAVAPPLASGIALAGSAVCVVLWLILLARQLARPPVERNDPAFWTKVDYRVILIGNTASILNFWAWMPYADIGLRLTSVIFMFGPMAIEVLMTIQRPRSHGRPSLAPFAIPTSTAIYFLAYWDSYSLAVGGFQVTTSYALYALRQVIQRAVDRAYEARRAAERALAQVAAERDAKTRFLASASHDLGQPLQAARLSFDQMLRATDPVQRERALKRVGWAFDTTEQLLRQMLDHLRLEAGAVEPHIGRVAVGPLMARIAEIHEPAARMAGIDVHVMPSRQVILADPELLERILGNLVVNSLRHAKASRVLMGVRRRGERVRLWVIDDGTGVAAADRERLFDDYVQGSNHGDEIRGGFGLGLASARRMAQLMAGEIALEAKWLNGSAFWVELPAADAKAA